MTDNEIIKAFECCVDHHVGACLDCPYKGRNNCHIEIKCDALALLKRQKEQRIDARRDEYPISHILYNAIVKTKTLEDYNKFKREFKRSAVKEFFEKVKQLYTGGENDR